MNTENKVSPFFIETCPKCNNRDKFIVKGYSFNTEAEKIEHFIYDDWKEYYFFLFSVSSICPSCRQYISANIAISQENKKNSASTILEYCNSDGELINDEDLLIYLDYPPLLPNFRPTIENQFPTVDLLNLYEQAEHCYKVHAWESVGVICRKIIDISTARVWKKKFNKKIPPLNIRIQELHLGKVFKNKNMEDIENELDFSNENHYIFYNMNQIRLLGNDAVHGNFIFFSDEAEACLIFTKDFINEDFLIN